MNLTNIFNFEFELELNNLNKIKNSRGVNRLIAGEFQKYLYTCTLLCQTMCCTFRSSARNLFERVDIWKWDVVNFLFKSFWLDTMRLKDITVNIYQCLTKVCLTSGAKVEFGAVRPNYRVEIDFFNYHAPSDCGSSLSSVVQKLF